MKHVHEKRFVVSEVYDEDKINTDTNKPTRTRAFTK